MRMNKIALNINNNQILFLIINLTLNFFYIFFICKNNQEPIFTNGIMKLLLANTFSFIFFISLDLKLRNKGINHKSNNIFSKTTSILLAFLISFLFWGLVPTIIDRSLSVNVIGTLNKANRSLTLYEINESLLKNYVRGDFQARKRIMEQIHVGTLKRNKDETFQLTFKGKLIAKLNLLIANYFNLDKSSASPEIIP